MWSCSWVSLCCFQRQNNGWCNKKYRQAIIKVEMCLGNSTASNILLKKLLTEALLFWIMRIYCKAHLLLKSFSKNKIKKISQTNSRPSGNTSNFEMGITIGSTCRMWPFLSSMCTLLFSLMFWLKNFSLGSLGLLTLFEKMPWIVLCAMNRFHETEAFTRPIRSRGPVSQVCSHGISCVISQQHSLFY